MKGYVIIEHIGGDLYWLGCLLMPHILTRQGPETILLLAWHRMWSCLWVSTLHASPREVGPPKGMPWEVRPGFPVLLGWLPALLGWLPALGSKPKVTDCKCATVVAQWKARTTGVRVN